MPVLGNAEGQIVSTPEPAASPSTGWRPGTAATSRRCSRIFTTMSSSAHRWRPSGPRLEREWCAASRRCGNTGHAALKTMPDLHFEIVGVYRGESVLVINYRNQGGALVNEVLEFDGGLVRRGHGTYLVRG